jgi:hypothetical protein
MKRMMLIIGLVSVVWGCNSNDKKKTDDTKTDIQVGVQNVNGNIPDTTNVMKLSTHKKDSTGMGTDSVK